MLHCKAYTTNVTSKDAPCVFCTHGTPAGGPGEGHVNFTKYKPRGNKWARHAMWMYPYLVTTRWHFARGFLNFDIHETLLMLRHLHERMWPPQIPFQDISVFTVCCVTP